jgi:membrane fusion protein (multidrug efflux system)
MVAPVVAKDVSPTWEYIGRVEPVQAVDITARVQGFLEEIAFEEGQDVTSGQELYLIEQAPYQAALDAANAQLSKAQATLETAQRNLSRAQQLNQRGFEAQASLDQATSARDTAAADVAAAQANLRTAQLNLGYTRITAPIDGRIGATAVTKGNLVGPNSGTLARIVQLDPIRVVFSVDDTALVRAKLRTGKTQEQLNAQFVPTLRLGDGSAYPEPGRIDFVNNEVDPNTGTVPVRAAFANPQRVLLPGQFLTVVIRPEATQHLPVVPPAAVQEDREGKYVLVVDGTDHVEQRRIKANRQSGQDWVVEEGLHEGDTVIVNGVQKVQPGSLVKPVVQRPGESGNQQAERG